MKSIFNISARSHAASAETTLRQKLRTSAQQLLDMEKLILEWESGRLTSGQFRSAVDAIANSIRSETN